MSAQLDAQNAPRNRIALFVMKVFSFLLMLNVMRVAVMGTLAKFHLVSVSNATRDVQIVPMIRAAMNVREPTLVSMVAVY